ncbi:MAG: RnfH family protein, partial [Gammaproteobacteria bacterium]|nr:RnfH family protein [Gammaproteobacteria bacterium]
MAPKTISVEVAYAEAEKQVLIRVSVPIGATVLEAITGSTVLSQFPHLTGPGILSISVGIFGKISTFDAVLKG